MIKILNYQITPVPVQKYVTAFLYTLLALIASKLAWSIMVSAPFMFFYGAVILSSWRGGIGPGMLSAALSIVLADFFLIEPLYQFFNTPTNVLQFFLFTAIAFLISSLEENRNYSERELREARDELSVILNTILDGITAQNQAGEFIFANQAASRLTGFPSAESIITTPPEQIQARYAMFDMDNEPLAFDQLPRHQVFKTGKSASLNFKIRFLTTGEEKWMEVSSAPIFDEDGSVKSVVNVLRDVSEQIEIQQERARLAAIIENSEEAIINKSLQRIITSWNPAAERLYGYTPEEAIGQHISLLFPDDRKEQEMNFPERIQRGERIQHYETQRRRKDGSSIDISLTISPIYNQHGKITGYTTIERDITDRVQIEKLREENARFVRNIIDSLPIMIGVMTPDGIIQQVNQTAINVARIGVNEIVGNRIDETPFFAYSPAVQADLQKAIRHAQKGEMVRYDVPIRIAEDDFMTIDFMISPLFDSDGKLTHLIPSALDISERKERENEILRLNQESEIQRRRLDTIIANIPGVVYEGVGPIGTEERHMTFISQYAEKMLGYPMSEWETTKNFWPKIVHPDDMEKARIRSKQIYESGVPGSNQFRCVTKDGKIVHAEAHSSVILDSNGERIGTCGVVMNITDRKQTEDQLLRMTLLYDRQNQRLSNLIGSIPGIVYENVVDPAIDSPQTVFVSDYAIKMMGYPLDVWKSDPNFWQKICHEEDWDSLAKEAQLAFEENRPGYAQFRCQTASGQMIYVEARFIFVADEQVVRSYGIYTNITERKEIENALAQYTEELRVSNQELEQFAYVASHDLQEPLRMVTSYLQLLERRYKDVLGQDGKDFIDFAVDGATRMKTLISDLLTYSRLQRNIGDIMEVSLQEILERVLYNLQISIEDTQAQIIYKELPTIQANEAQILQLFQNLLSNAIKFRRDEAPQIHIDAKRNGNYWWFSVQDNGIGIENEYLDRIFVIFQRLHTRDEYPGTGIGLAICKKIVEKHNGKIKVESRPGEGTTFTFSIPINHKKRIRLNASS